MPKPLTPELAVEGAGPRNAADGAGPDRIVYPLQDHWYR
jgi:hypothetical protein